MKRLFCYFILIGTVTGCELIPLACNTEAYPAIELTVKNSNGDFINDKVLAVVFEDNFIDTLTVSEINELGEIIRLRGADERSGNYSLIITSDQYKTYTDTGIRVKGSKCHVQTRELSVTLELK